MSATLDHLLEPLDHWLDDADVEEICLQPGTAWIFERGRFSRHDTALGVRQIEDIAICAGAQRRQDVGPDRPLLATDLRGRGRLQAVLAPAVSEMRPCLTIRRGASSWPTFAELEAGGLFAKTLPKRAGRDSTELMALYRAGAWQEFFERAVAEGRTILGCGQVASGKTHFIKACLRAIPDPNTRLITIEDSPELTGLERFFPNSVQLYYDKAGYGVTASDLVEASLRMRPERLVLQEVRDGQAAIAFLLALQSGHDGYTTIHAEDCAGAFDRLRVVIKQTPGGAHVSDADVMSQLRALVDVVVHMSRAGGQFGIDEVWFSDAAQD